MFGPRKCAPTHGASEAALRATRRKVQRVNSNDAAICTRSIPFIAELRPGFMRSRDQIEVESCQLL